MVLSSLSYPSTPVVPLTGLESGQFNVTEDSGGLTVEHFLFLVYHADILTTTSSHTNILTSLLCLLVSNTVIAVCSSLCCTYVYEVLYNVG